MKKITTHQEQLGYLRKIEGQVRGVERMIEEKRYCVDILIQLHSIVGAILRVEDEIFKKHMDSCVVGALKGGSGSERLKKIDEIVKLISRFRKVG